MHLVPDLARFGALFATGTTGWDEFEDIFEMEILEARMKCF